MSGCGIVSFTKLSQVLMLDAKGLFMACSVSSFSTEETTLSIIFTESTPKVKGSFIAGEMLS